MNQIANLVEELKKLVVEDRRDPTVMEFLQAHVHEAFTVAADKIAQMGYLSTDERISLSSAVGDMLGVFRKVGAEKCPAAAETLLNWDAIQKLMERD